MFRPLELLVNLGNRGIQDRRSPSPFSNEEVEVVDLFDLSLIPSWSSRLLVRSLRSVSCEILRNTFQIKDIDPTGLPPIDTPLDPFFTSGPSRSLGLYWFERTNSSLKGTLFHLNVKKLGFFDSPYSPNESR